MTVNERQDTTSAVPYDHVLFTDLDGAEGVLVDLNTKKYYQLNETASLVWRELQKGMPPREIAGKIAELYDVTPERAASSVETLLHSFVAQKLIPPL